METIEDFDKWLAEYKPPTINYIAVFDPSTGKVISVGPDFAFPNEKNKVDIDKDIAQSIICAEIPIEKCMIDISSGSLEIAELKTLVKLDDVLHRIISTEFSNLETPDVYLTFNKKSKTLKIQLSEVFGGTKKFKKKHKARKFVWEGSTVMNFIVTDYNDPNLIYEMHDVKISDIVGKDVTLKNIDYDNFSVYTRRLFKNYVIEYK
jgi:hypothetical protein